MNTFKWSTQSPELKENLFGSVLKVNINRVRELLGNEREITDIQEDLMRVSTVGLTLLEYIVMEPRFKIYYSNGKREILKNSDKTSMYIASLVLRAYEDYWEEMQIYYGFCIRDRSVSVMKHFSMKHYPDMVKRLHKLGIDSRVKIPSTTGAPPVEFYQEPWNKPHMTREWAIMMTRSGMYTFNDLESLAAQEELSRILYGYYDHTNKFESPVFIKEAMLRGFSIVYHEENSREYLMKNRGTGGIDQDLIIPPHSIDYFMKHVPQTPMGVFLLHSSYEENMQALDVDDWVGFPENNTGEDPATSEEDVQIESSNFYNVTKNQLFSALDFFYMHPSYNHSWLEPFGSSNVYKHYFDEKRVLYARVFYQAKRMKPRNDFMHMMRFCTDIPGLLLNLILIHLFR